MVIKNVELETVCGVTSMLPDNKLPEVAFAGKSNVGKSSLINALMMRKSLARTSAQPGKTQTINFYNINKEIYLVDLPGYGYAKASEKEREAWGQMIERYLNTSEKLRAVFLLVDIRHAPSANDKQMFEWMAYVGYDPWEGGVMSADYIADKIGDSGDIAVLEGLEGFNNTERIEGFVDQIEKKHPDIKIVASQAADWEREKGYSVAQNIMQANPDVKAFFAASDEMAIGAAQAMKDDGVDGIVTIGIDGNSATMDSIDEGVTTASLDTDPYNIGVTAVEKAIDAIDGKEIDDNKVIVPCFIVDKDNVADYLK